MTKVKRFLKKSTRPSETIEAVLISLTSLQESTAIR
nr:MAG TPA: hypothetical protein [Caudoviricetes sp.]